MVPAAAQISIYPLGRDDLSPAIDGALETFRASGLEVTPGAMSSIVAGDADLLFRALSEVYARLAGEGRVVVVATLSNACPVP